MNSTVKSRIVKTMKFLAAAGTGYDKQTGEFNCTELAEETVFTLMGDGVLDADLWLDDPDHIIWSVAIEVAEWAEKKGLGKPL